MEQEVEYMVAKERTMEPNLVWKGRNFRESRKLEGLDIRVDIGIVIEVKKKLNSPLYFDFRDRTILSSVTGL